ncbi:MAG: thiamine pyrophosphate-dependent enzyme, partial [Parasphingorhabdus sp.]
MAKSPRKTTPAKKTAAPKRAPAKAKSVVNSTGEFTAPVYSATKAEMMDFYEQMLLIRRFEEKAGQLYGLGLIGGFCHLYIGQEAVVTGLQSAISPGKDSVI